MTADPGGLREAREAHDFLSDRYYHVVESDGEDNAARFATIEAVIVHAERLALTPEATEPYAITYALERGSLDVEAMTAVIHDQLAASQGCHHPRFDVPTCERIALALGQPYKEGDPR